VQDNRTKMCQLISKTTVIRDSSRSVAARESQLDARVPLHRLRPFGYAFSSIRRSPCLSCSRTCRERLYLSRPLWTSVHIAFSVFSARLGPCLKHRRNLDLCAVLPMPSRDEERFAPRYVMTDIALRQAHLRGQHRNFKSRRFDQLTCETMDVWIFHAVCVGGCILASSSGSSSSNRWSKETTTSTTSSSPSPTTATTLLGQQNNFTLGPLRRTVLLRLLELKKAPISGGGSGKGVYVVFVTSRLKPVLILRVGQS
jgi:hypothetical protein